MTDDSDFASKTTRRAGLVVTIMSVIFVLGVVAVLAAFILKVEGKYERSTVAEFDVPQCETAECAFQSRLYALESEAQHLRTDRLRTGILSRVLIFVVAEIAGFALIVLGAVLVFDRVRTDKPPVGTGEHPQSMNWKELLISTPFPGLIMCMLGAITVIWAIQAGNSQFGRFRVYDVPVFLEDPNHGRNYQRRVCSGSQPIYPMSEQTHCGVRISEAAAQAPAGAAVVDLPFSLDNLGRN